MADDPSLLQLLSICIRRGSTALCLSPLSPSLIHIHWPCFFPCASIDRNNYVVMDQHPPHRPFHLLITVRVCKHEAVWGFHIKKSPSFKAKLAFIGLLSPERELTLFFFFDGSACLREIFSNVAMYSPGSRGGQKKWEWVGKVFISERCSPGRLSDIQGHLSWHLFYEKSSQRIAAGKRRCDMDVLVSPQDPMFVVGFWSAVTRRWRAYLII